MQKQDVVSGSAADGTHDRTPRSRGVERPSPNGASSLFRNKIRRPVSITLTPEHHVMIRRAALRLGLTRSDCIGLLIDRFAETVTIPKPLHASRER
jgi:hypothetical protein